MTNVISAVTARTQLGQILKRAGQGDERFLVDRRGEPAVIIMSIRDYIKNIAPPSIATAAIRMDAKSKGTSKLSVRELDRVIATVRRQNPTRTLKPPSK